MEIAQKMGKLFLKMLLVVVALVLVSTLNDLYRGRNNNNSDISFTDEEIRFLDVDGAAVVIPYSQVLSLELLPTPDYGEADGGAIRNNTRLGIWNSGQLGRYLTHSSTAVSSCILIKTAEGSFVVNYENDRTTAQLFEELQKYISIDTMGEG